MFRAVGVMWSCPGCNQMTFPATMITARIKYMKLRHRHSFYGSLGSSKSTSYSLNWMGSFDYLLILKNKISDCRSFSDLKTLTGLQDN